MLIIADQVRSWIHSHPLYADFLAQGIINSSALARKIKPELQAHTKKKVSLDAIILALNRYAKTAKPSDFTKFISKTSVQSNLSIITIPQSNLNEEAFSKALSILHKSGEYTLYTRGAWHISLIGKKGIVEELTRHFRYTTLAHNVAAVTIQLTPEHSSIFDIATYIVQKIMLENITIHETVSSHNELTIIVRKEDVKKALGCLS